MNAYVEGLKESPVSELKKSPIFAMSLSSKELFHSEFWAWLFARNIEYARIFFPNISTIENVGREEGNRDITVYSGGKGYVIENKVKSLPNVKQLEKFRYNKHVIYEICNEPNGRGGSWKNIRKNSLNSSRVS